MSEGGTHTDPQFVNNWNAAKNAGLEVNVYHYFLALSSTPEEQVANIKKNLLSVGFDPTMNLLAIDVEQEGNEPANQNQMADNLQNLLTQLKADVLSSVNPMIYCSPAYWMIALTGKNMILVYIRFGLLLMCRKSRAFLKPGTNQV